MIPYHMRYTLILLAAGTLISACGTVADKDSRPEVVVDTPAVMSDTAIRSKPATPMAAKQTIDHPDTGYIHAHAAGALEESPEISSDLLAQKKARLLVKNYTNDEAKAFRFFPDGTGYPRSLPTLLVLRYDDQEAVIDEGHYKKITCTLDGVPHTVHGQIHIRAGHTYLLEIKE
jgi:hypothetical protein